MNATLITGADAVALAERENLTLWRMEREYHSELTLDEARWALANRPDVVVAVLRREDGSYVGRNDDSMSADRVVWSANMTPSDSEAVYRITGSDAVRLAERDDLIIRCAANPVDDGGIVTPNEARGIVRQDPSLIYVLVTPRGWWNGQQVSDAPEGYNVHDYWNSAGMYLGPDGDGIEPTFDDAA